MLAERESIGFLIRDRMSHPAFALQRRLLYRAFKRCNVLQVDHRNAQAGDYNRTRCFRREQ